MKIVEINAFSNGSTGSIMMKIAENARKRGHSVWTYSTIVFSTNGALPKENIGKHYYYSSYFENFLHYGIAQLCDGNGMFSVIATIRLILQLKRIKPDIVQLHNIHEFCISLPVLFAYLRKNKINIVWTFHDCWAFTGHCMHFDYIKCELWKTGCHNCPQKYYDPRSRVDNSRMNWKIKKRLYSEYEKLTIVTPSKWLANLVKESFFKYNNAIVIHNGIDLGVFKPRGSEFKNRHGWSDKYLVLGVASGWSEMKGIDVFTRLASDLPDKYIIVIVGATYPTNNLQSANLYSIKRTNDKQELAQIYSSADVFVNPTREDTFPTVNIEALACGTPIVTYCTGGSPEVLDENCGIVVDKDDYNSLKKGIIRVCEEKPFLREKCVERAKLFDTDTCYSEYVNVYETIIKH